jgi:hypothetical protein
MSKYYGSQPSIQLAGNDFTMAALRKLFNADIAASDAVDEAKALWLKAAQAQTASRKKTNPVLTAIHRMVLSQYGDTRDAGDILAAFGLAPRSTRKATGKEMVAAAEKRAATRKGRRAIGTDQQKTINGSPAANPQTGS